MGCLFLTIRCDCFGLCMVFGRVWLFFDRLWFSVWGGCLGLFMQPVIVLPVIASSVVNAARDRLASSRNYSCQPGIYAYSFVRLFVRPLLLDVAICFAHPLPLTYPSHLTRSQWSHESYLLFLRPHFSITPASSHPHPTRLPTLTFHSPSDSTTVYATSHFEFPLRPGREPPSHPR